MKKIILPKISEEKIDDLSSKFTIEPLNPGYGPTLGNATRRVLLSSLPGAAITSFKIEGVSHEFTSVPHIKEDSIEIMLNLKTIKLKSFSDEPVILTARKKGPGELKASDLSKNSEVEILNPEQLIASLDDKAILDLEIVVEKDSGFRPTENKIESSSEIGRINIDASFSPIERVKMEISNTRVGQMTNYDKIELWVTTDGSINPKDAMVTASNILIDHYKVFAFDIETKEKLTEEMAEIQPDEKPETAEKDYVANEGETDQKIDGKIKIEDIGFSPRTKNALLNAGVKTLAGLQRLSDLKLSEIKGLGQKGITEIKQKV